MIGKRVNIGLVCTAGGHFEQLINLRDFFKKYDHFWITNRNKQTTSQLQNERQYFIYPGHYKKPWTYIDQIPFIIKIFEKEKPTHLLSTGSGRTAFIPIILAKMKKIEILYIDTFSRVKGHSKLGRFLISIGNQIYTQWNDHENRKAKYIGPLFESAKNFEKSVNSKYIFVTVGNRREPFKRLIEAVEALVRNGFIKEKVIVQAGHTKYFSKYIDIFDFDTPERISDIIINSKYVITQESAGIGTQCLKYGTKFIVMPRKYKYKELFSKSDMKEDLHLKLEELGYTRVVNDVMELKDAIENLENLKSGFLFDNKFAIDTLTGIVEGL